jgi:hypothetical protein
MIRTRTTIAAIAIAAALTTPAIAEPTPEVFSYQGVLEKNGEKVTGDADISVRLFDDLNNILAVDEHTNVPVTDGNFTILLRFDPDYFTGADYDLQFIVRSPAGSGNFFSLSPRTAVVSTPYAYHANTADTLIAPATITDNNGATPLTLHQSDFAVGPVALRATQGNLTSPFLPSILPHVADVETQTAPVGLAALATSFPIVGFLRDTPSDNNAAVLGQVLGTSNADARAVWALNQFSGNEAILGTNDHAADLVGDLRLEGDFTKSYTPGTYDLAAPIAYGFVNASGTIANGTPNFSAVWNVASSRYEIDIDNESYFFNQYVTVVTPTLTGQIARTSSVAGRLIVQIEDRATGAPEQGNFQFVTYKTSGAAALQGRNRPPLTPLNPALPLDTQFNTPQSTPRIPLERKRSTQQGVTTN